MITEVAFFVYPVSDVARARRFYEEDLGLKVESNFKDEWIEYAVASGTFAVTTADAAHRPGAKGGTIAFEVDDLERELARLKQRHVKFTLEPNESPVCRFAAVADPDGNEIIIHKRKL